MKLRLTDYLQRTIFSCLQNEQVELGRENGLSEKEIATYAKPYYNFRQMQEIRLAIEHNTNAKQRRGMCHPRYSPEEMRQLRLRLEHGELLIDPAVPMQVWVCGFAMIAAFAGLLMLCLKSVRGPYLRLKTNEVVLEKGDAFDPMAYVEGYSDGEGTLVLPEGIRTEEEGKQAAVYHFLSQGEDIMRTLVISVVRPAGTE